MRRLVKLCLFLLFCASSIKVIAQTLPNKTLYVHASAGLARSEDGLKFMVKESASQWTPKANLGFGYRFNKYLGIETHAATMLTSLKANGTLVLNNEKAEVTARHSNVMISPKFTCPLVINLNYFFEQDLVFYSLKARSIALQIPTLKNQLPTSDIWYRLVMPIN